MTIIHESFPVGPLQCNCTVLGNTETGRGYVFDPGGNPERIMEVVASFGLRIEALVHTHAHLDHILAAAEIQNLTGASVCLHPDDRWLWDSLESQCQLFGIPYKPAPEPDHWLDDEEPLHCGDGLCIHTPGHITRNPAVGQGRQCIRIISTRCSVRQATLSFGLGTSQI